MDIEYFIQNPKGHCLESHVKKAFPVEYPDIKLQEGYSFSEKIYRYLNPNYKNKCVVCGNKTKFKSIKVGFCKTCSPKCSAKDPERINKILDTKQELYGSQSYNNRAKFLKTMSGREWGFKNESIHQKIKELYGVDNISKLNEIKEKKIKTTHKNYGVDSPFQLITTQIRAKQALIDKYGVDSIFKLDEYKDKAYKKNKENVLKNHDDIVDVLRDNTWVGRCPHNTCNKCNEKIYYTRNQIYNDRKRNCAEQCTKLLPIGKSNQQTTIELFVQDILNRYNIEYKTNVRDIIFPKELDIYIPSKNIAIECNGVYWHSRGDGNRHNIKYEMCKHLNIQLLSIWEDWIKNKPTIIESIILSKLGIYNNKIGARQCTIKEISTKDCQLFLEKNHIQGRCKSNVRFGLYFNNELVSVMVFKHKSDGWDLTRYCCKIDTIVVGAASKLLKYFIKKYSPTTIVSYSCNDISNGDIYEKLGFTQYSHNIPYWYISQSDFKRYHRESFCKNNLKRLGFESGTEEEIMKKLPYWKIYDSGMIGWKLNL